jgi:hypothetical protein
MGLETRIAALQWAPSYKRATWMQFPLALLSFLRVVPIRVGLWPSICVCQDRWPARRAGAPAWLVQTTHSSAAELGSRKEFDEMNLLLQTQKLGDSSGKFYLLKGVG